MTTHAVGRPPRAEVQAWHGLSAHWTWLARGLAVAFVVPFLLTDVVEIDRDLFYGLYALSVAGLFWAWSRSTGYDLVAACRRRWPSQSCSGWGSRGS